MQQPRPWREKLTVAGAKRFVRHIVAKPFMNTWVYKFFPRLFLLAKFGVFQNTNTDSYWSTVHADEAFVHVNRFGETVRSVLNAVDFTDKDVLDVGCGQGTFLLNVSEARSRTGVDISPVAIDKIKQLGMEGVVRTLPVLALDRTFDIVTCFETLEHVPQWKKSLEEMIRAVKDTGYLIVSVPFEDRIVISEHVVYFDVERLYRFLRKKVTILDIRVLGPWVLFITTPHVFSPAEIPEYFFRSLKDC